jgi:hypothetical protein
MATTICKNCGTDMDFAARFCRRCGHQMDTSEATTRTLEEPERREAATRMTNSAVTSPTFEPPAYLSPQPPVTNSLEADRHKKNMMVLAGVVGVLLIAVIVLAVVLLNRGPDNPARGTDPERPGLPAPPPPPPPPPGVPASPAATAISSDLYYPGSRVVMEHTEASGREGKVVQLQVSASPEDVAAWYTAKIRPEKNTRMPGSIILESESIVVVINGADNFTSIILAQRKDR